MTNVVAIDTEELNDSSIMENDEVNNQYVTFHVGQEVFGFPMSTVLEIIRLPVTVQVPLTPGALVGLSNLRGSVLSILDLRIALGLEQREYDEATRVVVSDVGSPVGLVVDKVARVMDVAPEQIENSDQVNTSVDTNMLAGVIKGKKGSPLIQLLNIESLISQEFSSVLASAKNDAQLSTENTQELLDNEDDAEQLVSFVVESQEYAFNLMEVDEIVRVPDNISSVPGTEDYMLGLIDLRGRLLPLVSLRRFFSLEEQDINEDNRIVVVDLKLPGRYKSEIGLVVDDVKEVLRINPNDRDDMPTLLIEQEDANDISSICRLEEGKRLVSVLSAGSMFSHPMIQKVMKSRENEEKDDVNEIAENQNNDSLMVTEDDDTAQLVVFNLGEQEYGVSIDDVQEITRVPEKMEKVPKTADFIEGMVNLRGTVLPVLDMRTRFSLAKMENSERQRIIVLSLDGKHTGFIVDSVAEVLRLPHTYIEDAPNLSDDQARIMGRVINLKKGKRIIQVLSARELLSAQEKIDISVVE